MTNAVSWREQDGRELSQQFFDSQAGGVDANLTHSFERLTKLVEKQKITVRYCEITIQHCEILPFFIKIVKITEK